MIKQKKSINGNLIFRQKSTNSKNLVYSLKSSKLLRSFGWESRNGILKKKIG